MRISSKIVVVAAVASVLGANAAGAATTPEVKCQTGKLKAVGSFSNCLFKAEANGASQMLTPDFSKCQAKINDKFPKLELQAGPGICPSEMDLVDIRTRTEDFEADIAVLLAGGSLTTTTTTTTSTTLPAGACGNGVIELAEECDVGQLDGETCASQGFFNGELHCGPGCTFDTSDCNATRFVDTGNTILDYQTGLEWEKKTNSDGVANLANPHDVDNTYTWSVGAGVTTPNGSLYTEFAGDLHFLAAFNGVVTHVAAPGMSVLPPATCFESHCDWRVPNLEELKGLLLNPGCGAAPCVVDAVFLPNRSGRYWTDSTRDSGPSGAYFVDFVSPVLVASDAKNTAKFARAVRRFRD